MPESSSYRYANTRSVVWLRVFGLALCLLLLDGALTAEAASAGTRDPRVTFTVTPTSPIAGQPAMFDAGGTRCYGSGRWSSVNCASYTWTDDGDPNAPLDAPMWSLGSGRVTKFTFAEGPWTVWLWLTVRDRAGRQTRVMKRVDVRASQPAPPPQPEPDPEPQPEPPPPPSGSCDTVVSSTSAATSAVAAAAPGTRVCLADGTYGGITLGAAKSDYVTLAAQNPGKALVRGQVTFAGSARKLRIEGFDIQSSNIGVLVNPGAQGIAIERNHVHDTPYEIEIQDAERGQPATDFEVKDVLVRGNRLSRPSENAIRASGFDGLVIENNEITGCVEDGAHVDGFQAMFGGRGLVFRRNYFHDNNCQNFFMADGTYYDVVHEDNLYIRNDAPASLPIGQTVNLYSIVDGPDADSYGLVSRHNTSWTAPGNDAVLYQGGPWSQALVTDEVYYRVHASPGPAATTGNNVWCKWENPSPTFPGPGPGSTQNCGPAFRAPASDDYRLAGGQGVTWSPADYRYGP